MTVKEVTWWYNQLGIPAQVNICYCPVTRICLHRHLTTIHFTAWSFFLLQQAPYKTLTPGLITKYMYFAVVTWVQCCRQEAFRSFWNPLRTSYWEFKLRPTSCAYITWYTIVTSVRYFLWLLHTIWSYWSPARMCWVLGHLGNGANMCVLIFHFLGMVFIVTD